VRNHLESAPRDEQLALLAQTVRSDLDLSDGLVHVVQRVGFALDETEREFLLVAVRSVVGQVVDAHVALARLQRLFFELFSLAQQAPA